MQQFILALDQGTASSRAVIFTHQGETIALAQKEVTQLYPQPGWLAHDAQEIWSLQMTVATEALLKAQLAPNQIAAIQVLYGRRFFAADA